MGLRTARKFEEFEPARLVKSVERVRNLGEVFTPSNIVDDMLDLLPDEIWQIHPSKTFLEPAVGNGNFVSAILSRKLTLIDEAFDKGSLPAGTSKEAAEFHALEALSSIYGVDISEDNIIGGTPGHEVACRPRLLQIMHRWHEKALKNDASPSSEFHKSARWIVDNNMIIGNMLEFDASGDRVDRESIILHEYRWDAQSMSLQLLRTSLASIIEIEREASTDAFTLFGPEGPAKVWEGDALKLHSFGSTAVTELTGTSMSNSRSRG